MTGCMKRREAGKSRIALDRTSSFENGSNAMLRTKRFFQVSVGAIMLLAGAPVAYAGFLRMTGNLHLVEPDVAWRSAQLDEDDLDRFVWTHGIRTIVNLRHADKSDPVLRAERFVAAANGIDYHSIPISANTEPDMKTMETLVEVMRTAPKPMLIHCRGGSDRSGLAAALFEYAVEGRSVETASEQLSFAYGHFPWLWSRTGAMDRAFANFAARRKPSEAANAPNSARVSARVADDGPEAAR